MHKIMIHEIDQTFRRTLALLLTPTEAARSKGLTLNHFKYLLATQPGPEPVAVGRSHVFYQAAEVAAWQPRVTKKRKTKEEIKK